MSERTERHETRIKALLALGETDEHKAPDHWSFMVLREFLAEYADRLPERSIITFTDDGVAVMEFHEPVYADIEFNRSGILETWIRGVESTKFPISDKSVD